MPWSTVRIRGESKDRLEDLTDLLDESQAAIVSDLVDEHHDQFFDEQQQRHIRHTRGEHEDSDLESDRTRFRL